jgi:magnesium transporter
MLIETHPRAPVDGDPKIQKLAFTIDRLQRRAATRPLQKVISKTHPADLAAVLNSMPDGRVAPIFNSIPDDEAAAEALTQVSNRVRDLILAETPIERMVPVLEHLPPDELTDLIRALEPELADRLMSAIAKDSQAEVEDLLQYARDTAGGIMTTDFSALPDDRRVQEAIEAVRDLQDVEIIFYLYVTDAEGRLTGVISLRQLLLAQPDAQLREIMNSRVIKVQTHTPQETVANLVDKYRLLAVPVVDEGNLLVGVVTVDDVIEVMESETTKEMLRMAGTNESEILTQSPLKIARIRLPWLLAAFVGGLAATGVIKQFENILAEVLALSAFLPVVMGMAGNVGVQSATVAVRGLATGSLELRHIRSVLYKEFRVGLLLGIFYGLVLGAFGWFAFGSVELGEVVGLTIMLNMTGAAMLAIALPMLFHRIGTDPAIATGPFVTTAIDVLGVLNYFAIATAIIDFEGIPAVTG